METNSSNRFLNSLKESYFNSENGVRIYLFSLLVGFIGGIGAWLFHEVILLIKYLLLRLPYDSLINSDYSALSWLPFLIAPAFGGLCVGLINNRLPSELKGHGIPNVIEAIHIKSGRMSPLTPIWKLITASLTLGSGGSAGTEGPIAQIGGGLGSYLGQKFNLSPKEMRTLVLAGVAAGISAIFNAPIGGLLFAIEVVKRKSTIHVLIPVIIASIMGSITTHYIFGLEPALIISMELPLPQITDMLYFILLGFIGGLLSALWIHFFYKMERVQDVLFYNLRIPQYAKPAIGGLAIGIILIISYFLLGDDWEKFTVMGNSFKPMQALLSNSLYFGPLPILLVLSILLLLKAFATSITIGSGGSGGLFTPTLFIGLVFGVLFGNFIRLFFPISDELIIILGLAGMSALFAGSIRGPVTAVVIIVEITGSYELILPIFVSVVISFIVASKFAPEDLYSRSLLHKGVILVDSFADVMDAIPVSKAMVPADQVLSISPSLSCAEVLKIIKSTDYNGFPVIDTGELKGIVTVHDLFDMNLENESSVTIKELLARKKNQKIYCMKPSSHLNHAIAIMRMKQISRIPIINQNPDGSNEFVGWLTLQDIETSYSSMQFDIDPVELRNHLIEFSPKYEEKN